MSETITAVVEGVEFTMDNYTIQTDFDVDHVPEEFEWIEVSGGLIVPVLVNPHKTKPVVKSKQTKGSLHHVVGFPVLELLDNYSSSGPLTLDITLHTDPQIRLEGVVIERMPMYPQKKRVLDEIEFVAESVVPVE